LVVDKQAVLRVRPVVALARSSPGLHKPAVRVEFQDWRRGAVFLIRRHLTEPVQHPDMIASIDGDAGDDADDPVAGQRWRPLP